jgi:protein TonB
VALYGGLPSRESLEEPLVPPPLVTRLVELPKPEAEPALPPPAEKKKPSPPRRDTPRAEAPKPLPQAAPVAEPLPQPAPPAPPQPQSAQPPVAAPPPVAAAPVSPQPQVDTRAAEAVTAAQYRLQLIEAARRNRPPYPALARENNWTGRVVLEIVIRADGNAELGLRRSSGHALLDKLALDTFQQALRVVPVPPTLRGRQVRLEPLPVIYNLTEN